MGASAMTVGQLEDLKEKSLAVFDRVEAHFRSLVETFDGKGPHAPELEELKDQIQRELMEIRFTAKTADRLCESLRRTIGIVRGSERTVYDEYVRHLHLPANGSSPISFPMPPASAGSMRWRPLIPTRRRSFFICGDG